MRLLFGSCYVGRGAFAGCVVLWPPAAAAPSMLSQESTLVRWAVDVMSLQPRRFLALRDSANESAAAGSDMALATPASGPMVCPCVRCVVGGPRRRAQMRAPRQSAERRSWVRRVELIGR